MASFSKVILVGNLTRDPELRYSQTGTPVTRLRMAVNRYRKDKEGNRDDEVSYFDLACFGNQAETLAKYVEKGSPLLVDGRLRSWQTEKEDGTRRSGVEVVIEQFRLLPRRGGGETAA